MEDQYNHEKGGRRGKKKKGDLSPQSFHSETANNSIKVGWLGQMQQ